MEEELLEKTIHRIRKPDAEAKKAAEKRWDGIAKPLHSLGRLEDAVVQLAGIQRTERISVKKKALVVFCADNGVVEEGVTQTGQEVTAIVAANFGKGRTCTSIFCQDAHTDLFVLDVGMAVDVPGVRSCKAAYGTKNIAKGPAMTREQAFASIAVGIRMAQELKAQGYGLVAAGEMGIGNTTTSSAVSVILTGRPVEEMTGFGAGLGQAGWERKVAVIRTAIAKNQPDPCDPVDVLAKVGGFDLAAMTGFYLGAAAVGMGAVMDGVISQTAALAAVRLCPEANGYLLASHASREPAGRALLEALGKAPLLDGGMCLGEGSGAVLFFPLLESALHVYEQMSTFEEINVEAYIPLL